MHGCGSFSTETAGNPRLELPRRLAHPCPVGGRTSILQIRAPQPLRVPRTQGQFCQECAVPQPTNLVPGNSYRLSPNEGCGYARTCTGHSATRGFIQTRSPSHPQSISVRRKPAFGPRSKKKGYLHINCLEMLAVWLSLRTFLPDLRGHHILVHSDSMMVLSYINRQGGLSSRRLFILAERLFRWAQLNLRLLRAAHMLGKLNLGADMLSWSNVPSDEWMLHPQTVQVIWGIFGRPEVDIFASEDNTHCQTCFSKDRDALAHLLLYAFPSSP